jgi:hypothetical protein
MTVITALLNTLAIRRSTMECLKAQVRAAAGSLADDLDKAEAEVKALEADVKDKAKFVPDSQAHTLKGDSLQLVWTKGKKALDEDLTVKALQAAGWTQDAIDGLYTTGTGFWSIRKKGVK